MIYLLLSVFSSSIIFIVFKLFSKYDVNTLQAIVFNYFIAFAAGILAYSGTVSIDAVLSASWLPGTIFLGVLFIVVFNLMAITTQRSGLSVVSVATKMSVVVPIVFGITYYRDELGILKILGILLALGAVYLASIKKKEGVKIKKKNLLYPVLVFLGSGIIDTTLKFLEDSYVAEDDVPIFSAMIFATAALMGLLVFAYQSIKGTFRLAGRNIVGGIALGIPNYFSIYFLVQALRTPGLDTSTVFTINNVSIVMLSTILGITIFRERLLKKNWIGIGLAVLSIILVTLSL